MGQSSFYFDHWDSGVNYAKFDVVNGIASVTENKYYYSTADNNLNNNPNAQFLYRIYSGVRYKDEVTLYIFSTGNAPILNPGSIFRCVTVDPQANFSGMAIGGELNNGSGYIKYINAGKNSAFGSGGFAICDMNPYFTTGFYWIPSYSSSIDVKPNVILAQYGDSYSQRSPAGLNPNNSSWSLVFQSRKDEEARAIQNFVEDKMGSSSFPILIPVGLLKNNPGLKYVATDSKLTTDSFGLSSVSVTLNRVFDL